MTPHPPLVVLAGPTATGKTGLSLALADALIADGVGVEIISADSRQVFRGLDIGCAKVTTVERQRVVHHGLDLVDPDARFTVGDFVAHARDALVAIAGRGHVALLVGGTGLYIRAVHGGLDVGALPDDPALRARLEADLADAGLEALVSRLRALAPQSAATIDLRNPRRVVRALEIALLAGDRPRPPLRGYPGPALAFRVDVGDRTEHERRIAARARQQFDAGLVEEARALRARFDPTLPAFSAIGYREAWAVIDGTRSLEEAIALDAARNRVFARRQRTWFRREPELEPLDSTADPLRPALDRVRRFLAAARVS